MIAQILPVTNAVQAWIFALLKETVDKLDKLNVLVNNAAFQLHVSEFEDLAEEHFDCTLKTNLYGYFHMAHAAVPFMDYGSAIINTGSVTGIIG